MAAISSLGVGSGIDIQGLVSSLLQAEGAAKAQRFDAKQIEYEAKLSMYSTVKSALSDFQSSFSELKLTSSYNTLTAISSDESAFSASVSSSAAESGSYDIEVDQIAQSQKLTSAAFSSKSDTVGTGTLILNFGTYTYDGLGNVTGFTQDAAASAEEIEITDGSLSGIRDAINDADIGITASIIKDPATGYKLVVTSETGEENALNITVKAGTDSDGNDEDNSGLSQLAYDPMATYSGAALTNLTESQKALSAELTVDGVSIISASNTITDVIEGVDLVVAGTTTATEKLTIDRDNTNIEEAVQGFVDGYNNLMSVLNSASFYDEETGNSGILIGDATVRGIVNQIRNVLNQTTVDPTEKYNSLASLGILTARDGTLEYDSSKLSDALDEDADAVQYLLSGGDTSVSSGYLNVLGITDNIPGGSYGIDISSVPKQGTILGNFGVSTTALDFVTNGADTLQLTIDNGNGATGVTTNAINFTDDYYQGGALTDQEAVNAFVIDLQNKINNDANLVAAGLSVTVTAEWHLSLADRVRFRITSDTYSAESNVQVIDQLTAPRIDVGPGTAGVDGVAEIGGEAATFDGNILTGTGLFAGFEIEVDAGRVDDASKPTSINDTISVTTGRLSALDTLLSSFIDNGILDSKTDGLNKSLDDLDEQRVNLEERLAKLEERYIKQFSAMDALVAQLNSTSSYLENQLKALPGARQQSS